MIKTINIILKVLMCFAIALIVNHALSSFITEGHQEIIQKKIDTIATIDCEVYACRSEVVEDHRYSDIGLPLKREWLTSREWKGEHLSEIKGNQKLIRAKFKEWKKCHIIKFIEFMAKSSIVECKVYPDLKPSVIIAQAILESNFGLSRLAKQGNNLFGHKYRGSNSAFIVAMDDSPTDRFTVFTSVWYSLRNHSRILMRHYRKRIKGPVTVDAWLSALCGGMTAKQSRAWRKKGNTVYATSCMTEVCYAQKLKKVIKAYNLLRFDT